MQHHIEGTWQAVRFQDTVGLSCGPAYECHHRAALARCTHRDRKPSFGAYGFENHPDICECAQSGRLINTSLSRSYDWVRYNPIVNQFIQRGNPMGSVAY